MTEARGPNPPDTPAEPTWKVYVTDLVSSVGAVAMVGLLLFAVSGVWPPLVAIESQSMEPHIGVGDLVLVMESDRFAGPNAQPGTGVVTARAAGASGYSTFQQPGDVIVYAPNGDNETTPIIHRAMFWVAENERWYDEADPSFVGSADNCDDLAHCPANQSGFITKGDNNAHYDQVGSNPISEPVRPGWVVGTAEARIPWLGCIRLSATSTAPIPDTCRLF